MDTPTGAAHESAHLLTRGVVEVLGGARLNERLAAGERLRIKLGIDPTSPNLHLGRSIPLLKLRDFQQLGHTVVFIVGDFTGVIGDTSDKETERPMLSQAEVDANKAHYLHQVGKLIDLSQAEFHYNSEWLAPLSYRDIGEHADCFSVADFIARENIQKRLAAGRRVSLREMLYPLMQGYDSVAVRADVELGGTDQRFNLLAGRALQERAGMEPQAIVMGPLIAGLDGRKMSSSWGNTINLADAPADMFGKVMSLRDELVLSYFELVTRVPFEDIAGMREGLVCGSLHPKEAKMRLAHAIVELYHGAAQANVAQQGFVDTFVEHRTPDVMDEVVGTQGALLVDVLISAGCVESKAQWRRLVEGGGVHILPPQGGQIETYDVTLTEPLTLKIGKRRFVRVLVK